MAAMPRLATAAAAGDLPGFAAAWRKCLHYATRPRCHRVPADAVSRLPLRTWSARASSPNRVLVTELGACLAIASGRSAGRGDP